MSDTKAFIIGNGKSREKLELLALKEHGVSFGCNLLFTEFMQPEDFEAESSEYPFPDYTVSIEDYRKEMIADGGFPLERCLYPPEQDQYELKEYHNGAEVRPRSNAGMNAMVEAIRMKHRELYLIGFDAVIVDKDIATSNMFEGRPETRTNYHDTVRRVKYLDWFMNSTPYVNYTLVFPEIYTFHRLTAPNCKGVLWDKLIDRLKNESS